jgi:hypothetical protein
VVPRQRAQLRQLCGGTLQPLIVTFSGRFNDRATNISGLADDRFARPFHNRSFHELNPRPIGRRKFAACRTSSLPYPNIDPQLTPPFVLFCRLMLVAARLSWISRRTRRSVIVVHKNPTRYPTSTAARRSRRRPCHKCTGQIAHKISWGRGFASGNPVLRKMLEKLGGVRSLKLPWVGIQDLRSVARRAGNSGHECPASLAGRLLPRASRST